MGMLAADTLAANVSPEAFGVAATSVAPADVLAVAVGVMVRAGRLPVWPNESTLHGFVRADMHVVGYDATLQGGYFSDSDPHTVEPKRVVGEAEAGVVWSDGAYGARVGIVRRTNEISALTNSVGAQNFVRLQFSYIP